ncbi:sodium/calcium exchanger 3-like [Oncorhynchus tshawytscha]|uniref:sodium/calcium exchanger 3-like n=1 Tax=Oncorhynchus tshawytscha TaxID=74940 RepID=UPI001C3D11F6|nr:sodium/calcium exchanger 3-like [Oncorhynchus tshawytscha]
MIPIESISGLGVSETRFPYQQPLKRAGRSYGSPYGPANRTVIWTVTPLLPHNNQKPPSSPTTTRNPPPPPLQPENPLLPHNNQRTPIPPPQQPENPLLPHNNQRTPPPPPQQPENPTSSPTTTREPPPPPPQQPENPPSFPTTTREPPFLPHNNQRTPFTPYVPKLLSEEEEAKRIAEMGKPSLGEHSKMEVFIEESYEFKNTVDKLIKKTNLALVVGTNSWRQQFMEAITVSAGDEDEEDSGEERLPSCCDYVMHFLTVFWKVLFACVPPTDYLNGWACFFISIVIIGMLTAVIGDLASHFGCTIGLKDSVTAMVFVALGTSVPDTFASKVAAMQDTYADASIGNVTGSNAVNVFLGIGVAWSIAAIYWHMQGKQFVVEAGSLAFSVTLYTIFAFLGVSVLLYRRRAHIGGELGGPRGHRLATSAFFFSLWFLYILFSSMEAYCHIEGF